MLRTSLKFAWFVIVACALSAGFARAVTVDTLFNTGVDASGAVLPDGTVGDPHYTLMSVPPAVPPDGSTTDIRIRDYATYGNTLPGNPMWNYVGDSLTSRWIGPNNASTYDSGDGTGPHQYYFFGGPVGNYIYRTTFDLTGFDPMAVSISGRWSTDNYGREMLLNGVNTGNVNNAEFGVWTDFSITSGFMPGINTLDFVVENIGGPTALRVEMTGAAVPLPAAAWCGLGLLGVMVTMRCHRRKHAIA